MARSLRLDRQVELNLDSTNRSSQATRPTITDIPRCDTTSMTTSSLRYANGKGDLLRMNDLVQLF